MDCQWTVNLVDKSEYKLANRSQRKQFMKASSAIERRLTTLTQTLCTHAARQPGERAFVFLNDNGQTQQTITYRELVNHSKAIAAHLLQRVEPGDRVVLCYHPGLNFIQVFYACLFAGVVAVPVYPPKPRQKFDRMGKIIDSCQAKLVLCEQSIDLQSTVGDAPYLQDGRLLNTCELDLDTIDTSALPDVDAQHLAFLQYTSGSTGEPKGVMVSQGNIMANMRALEEQTQCHKEDVFVNWLPLFHDLGLVNTVLLPMYLGSLSVLMPPIGFIQRPRLWLETITEYRGSICGAPNFAFDLCVARIPQDDLDGLDLTCWKFAFNAAEPIHEATLDNFVERFAPAGFPEYAFYPSYGMAEATVFLTGGKHDIKPRVLSYEQVVLDNNGSDDDEDHSGKRLVSCGSTPSEHQFKIVDSQTFKPLAQGCVGEIWVSGPSIAQGYWALPERTAESFNAKMIGSDANWLRTGDLGCCFDEELYVTGRIKDLIVIHGQNFYPSDIEASVQGAHEALRKNAGVAFSIT
ncbi:MAG: acyl-CoA synthetase (AMP-forming)/AMP-acid ligase II, partial [Phenylobacterium sp.]